MIVYHPNMMPLNLFGSLHFRAHSDKSLSNYDWDYALTSFQLFEVCIVSFSKVLASSYWTLPVCVLKLTWTLIKSLVLYLLYVKHYKEVNFDFLVLNYSF